MRNFSVAFIVIILSAEFHLKSLYLQSVLKALDSYTWPCQWILRHCCLFFHGCSDIWHQLRAEQSKLPRKTFDSSSSSSGFGHLDACPDVPLRSPETVCSSRSQLSFEALWSAKVPKHFSRLSRNGWKIIGGRKKTDKIATSNSRPTSVSLAGAPTAEL